MFSENLKTAIQTSYSQNCVKTLPRRNCRGMLADITSEFWVATRHVLLTRESSTYSVLYRDYHFISIRRNLLVYLAYIFWENSSRIIWRNDMLFQQHRVPPAFTHSRYWRDFLDRKFLRKGTARGGPITGPPRARQFKPHFSSPWGTQRMLTTSHHCIPLCRTFRGVRDAAVAAAPTTVTYLSNLKADTICARLLTVP